MEVPGTVGGVSSIIFPPVMEIRQPATDHNASMVALKVALGRMAAPALAGSGM